MERFAGLLQVMVIWWPIEDFWWGSAALARAYFMENVKVLWDDKRNKIIAARVHQKEMIGTTNWLISLRCVLCDDEASTGNMMSSEVGPFSVSLISRHGFFRQFGENLVSMVDYRCCSLLSPLSYDMGRSIDEKFRGFTVRIDDLVTTWGFVVEVTVKFSLFSTRSRYFHKMTRNHNEYCWGILDGFQK